MLPSNYDKRTIKFQKVRKFADCCDCDTLIDIVYTNAIEKERTYGMLVRPNSAQQMHLCMINENYIEPKRKQNKLKCEIKSLSKNLELTQPMLKFLQDYEKLTYDPNTINKTLSRIVETGKLRNFRKFACF